MSAHCIKVRSVSKGIDSGVFRKILNIQNYMYLLKIVVYIIHEDSSHFFDCNLSKYHPIVHMFV